MRKPLPVVEFVECKQFPGNLQFWTNTCFIYRVCRECKTTTGHTVFEHHTAHFNHYRISLKKLPKETWEVYWDRAEKIILEDKAKYFYASVV